MYSCVLISHNLTHHVLYQHTVVMFTLTTNSQDTQKKPDRNQGTSANVNTRSDFWLDCENSCKELMELV